MRPVTRARVVALVSALIASALLDAPAPDPTHQSGRAREVPTASGPAEPRVVDVAVQPPGLPRGLPPLVALDPSDPGYTVDLAEGGERAVGYRVTHDETGRYVDVRLDGLGEAEVRRRGGGVYEFEPREGMRVVYETRPGHIKETIVLDDTRTHELSYAIDAPGLTPVLEGDEVVFHAPDYPAMFRLGEVVAWDSRGTGIPASLQLESPDELVLRLDEEVLGDARPPVVIDPRMIVGPDDLLVTEGVSRRALSRTSDGKLVFFYRAQTPDGPRLVYVVSSDDGKTWSAPVVVGEVGSLTDVSVVKDESDSFLVTYSNGTTDSAWVAFRKLTRSADTWTVGQEQRVATGVSFRPAPSLVDRGSGPLGRRMAVGFTRYDTVLGLFEYAVSFSEDSGQNWTLPTGCFTNSYRGVLATQGERLLCLIVPNATADLRWKELVGATWGPAHVIPIGYRQAPSTTLTDDGRLHLVAEAAGTVFHTFLAPGGAEFAPPVAVGSGYAPVVSTTGTALFAYAYEPVGARESVIRSYVAANGTSFAAHRTLGGEPFTYVLDENAGWAFDDLAGDALFRLSDGSGTLGNRVGTGSTWHVLDAPAKRLSFSFVPGVSGTARTLTLWTVVADPPKYRIGLQSDCAAAGAGCSGSPSGAWLDEVRVGGVAVSGAFSDVRPSGGVLQVTIPDTALTAGTRYHLVVEAAPATPLDPPASPSHGIAVQAVNADSDAVGSLAVLDSTAATWTTASGQVPRFSVSGPSGALASQLVAPGVPMWAGEYHVPGESFVAARDVSPTQVGVHLQKVGNPSGSITLRLLDTSGAQLWAASGTPVGPGWFSLPASGVTLALGTRYRLVVDTPNRDLANYWTVSTSGDDATSFDGATSRLSRAFDRPGLNDRSAEAADARAAPVDLVAFNSAATDSLYLGHDEQFDFASLTRLATSPLGSVGTALAYWDGFAWKPLSASRNELGAPSGGDAAFSPPPDWEPTTLGGRRAYWVKVSATGTAPTPIHVSRLSGILNLQFPTAAARGGGYVPLAWTRYTTPAAIEFLPHETGPPQASLVVNGGSPLTYSREVSARLTCTDVTGCARVRFSNDAGATWSVFQGFTEQKRWILPDADGSHTVTAEVVDGAGNPSLVTDGVQAQVSGATPGEGAHGAIVHAPVLKGSAGQDLRTSAEASCRNATCTMRLYHRTPSGYVTDESGNVLTGGDLAGIAVVCCVHPGWTELAAHTTTATPLPPEVGGYRVRFDFTIPGASVGLKGLDYFLLLTDPDPVAPVNPEGRFYWPGAAFVRSGYQHVQVGDGPVIAHVPPHHSFAGRDIEILAEVTCPGGLDNCGVTLGYRPPDPSLFAGPPFTTVAMAKDTRFPAQANTATFRGTIPASVATTRGVDYHIRATDTQGTARWPAGVPYHGYGADLAPDGTIAGTYYRMDVLATPVIAHTPQPAAQFRKPVMVKFAANCSANTACTATLWYRTTPNGRNLDTSQVLPGEPATTNPPPPPCAPPDLTQWRKVELPHTRAVSATTDQTGGLTEYVWETAIPECHVDTRGVDYLIKVSDGSTSAYWPSAPYEAWVGLQPTPLLAYHVHTLTAPLIAHTPVVAARAGQPITIAWRFICAAAAATTCQTGANHRNGRRDPVSTGAFAPLTTTTTLVESHDGYHVFDATATIQSGNATAPEQQYWLWGDDGNTRTYSPGSTYQGYVIPTDGVNLGQNVPYTIYLYGSVARSDTLGLENFYPYRTWGLGTGEAHVNMATGNLVVHHADLDVPGQGLNLRVTRTYNRQSHEDGVLGPGWTLGVAAGAGLHAEALSGAISLDVGRALGAIDTPDSFTFVDGDGTRHHFVRGGPPGPGWHSPPGLDLTLQEVVDGAGTRVGFDLLRPDGVRYELRRAGTLLDRYALARVANRAGNELVFSYDADGFLETIADPAGRQVIFGYQTVAASKRYLTSMTYRSGSEELRTVYRVTPGVGLGSVTEAAGSPAERTTGYAYLPGVGLVEARDARGGSTWFNLVGDMTTSVRDRVGNTWRIDYSAESTACQPAAGYTAFATCLTHPKDDITNQNEPPNTEVWTVSSQNNLLHLRDPGDANADGTPRHNAQRLEWGSNRLTRHIDEAGSVTEYDYNPNGQITESRFTGVGEPTLTTRFEYQASPTWPGVADLTATVLAAGSPEERRWTYAYEGDTGLVSSVTDPVGQATQATSFAYYLGGRLRSVRDPRGKTTTFGDPALADGGYHASGRPTRITDPTGAVTTVAYDFLGRQTQVTDRAGASWTYAWDLRGNPRRETDPIGNVTAHCYDRNDNELVTIRPKGRTNECAEMPDDHATVRTYDARDLPSQVEARSDGQVRRQALHYYNDGELRAVVGPSWQMTRPSLTGPRNPEIEYERYPNNRVKAFEDAGLDTANVPSDIAGNRTEYLYTPDGLVATVTEPAHDDAGTRRTTTSTYDGRGQPTSVLVSGHGGAATTFAYNVHGERTRVTTPAGRATTFGYDALGRPSRTTYHDGTFSERAYDPAGNLTSVSHPTGAGARLTTTYTHTDRGEIATESDPADPRHTVGYEYDPEGRQRFRRDLYDGAEERTVESQWRADGRLARRLGTGTGMLGHDVTYAYDANGNPTTIETRAGPDLLSTIAATYSSADEIRTWSETISGVTKTSSFTWSPEGLLYERTDDAKTTIYDHYLNGLEYRTRPWNGYDIRSFYFPSGGLKQLNHLVSGRVLTQAYDAAGRVASRRFTANGLVLSAWESIAYDADDHRVSEVVTQRQPPAGINYDPATYEVRSGTATYGYDSLGRLASAKHPFETATANYALDQAGNVTADSEFTYAYATNRLTSRQGVSGGAAFTYGYDHLGNMTSATGPNGTATTTYDGAGHTRQTTLPDGSFVRYAYDGLDRLVLHETPQGSTRFFHDRSSDQVTTEVATDSTGDVDTTAYMLDSTGAPLGQDRDDEHLPPGTSRQTFFVTDPRANVTQVFDYGQHTVVEAFGYDPFGKDKPAQITQLPGHDTTLRYQLAPRDRRNGTYAIGPRIYDPDIHRFVSVDEFTNAVPNLDLALDPLTGNRYLYAGADPVNLIDDGHAGKSASKKKLQQGIESLQERIREHEQKIAQERRKERPNQGRIRKWQREIETFKRNIERKARHLMSLEFPDWETGGSSIGIEIGAAGGVIVGIWWAGKLLSPACGPFAPACAYVL